MMTFGDEGYTSRCTNGIGLRDPVDWGIYMHILIDTNIYRYNIKRGQMDHGHRCDLDKHA